MFDDPSAQSTPQTRFVDAVELDEHVGLQVTRDRGEMLGGRKGGAPRPRFICCVHFVFFWRGGKAVRRSVRWQSCQSSIVWHIHEHRCLATCISTIANEIGRNLTKPIVLWVPTLLCRSEVCPVSVWSSAEASISSPANRTSASSPAISRVSSRLTIPGGRWRGLLLAPVLARAQGSGVAYWVLGGVKRDKFFGCSITCAQVPILPQQRVQPESVMPCCPFSVSVFPAKSASFLSAHTNTLSSACLLPSRLPLLPPPHFFVHFSSTGSHAPAATCSILHNLSRPLHRDTVTQDDQSRPPLMSMRPAARTPRDLVNFNYSFLTTSILCPLAVWRTPREGYPTLHIFGPLLHTFLSHSWQPEGPSLTTTLVHFSYSA